MADMTREIIEKAKIYLEREKATTTCGKNNFAYNLTNEELELLVDKLEAYENADLIDVNMLKNIRIKGTVQGSPYGEVKELIILPYKNLSDIPRFNPERQADND